MGRQGLCLNLGKGMSEKCRTEVEEGFHVIHCAHEKLDLYYTSRRQRVYLHYCLTLRPIGEYKIVVFTKHGIMLWLTPYLLTCRIRESFGLA